MEILGLIWIPNFVIWILVIFIILFIYGKYPHSTLSYHGYKGPQPKAFLGNADLLFDGYMGKWDLTGKGIYGKIFAMYEGRVPTLVVFDTDVLKHVLVRDFSSFSDRRYRPFMGPVLQHSLLVATGKKWKRIRSLVSPFFTSGKIKRSIPGLQLCANNLLKRCKKFAEDGEDIHVKEVVGAYTLEAICLTAFGVQVDSQENPDNTLYTVMKKSGDIKTAWWMYLGFFFPFVTPWLEWLGLTFMHEDTIDALVKLTKEAIEERKRTQEDRADFIQTVMKAHEMDLELETAGATADEAKKWKALSDIEIVAQAALFTMAGYGATADTTTFLLFSLATNQQCQDKLVQEIQDEIGDGEITYDNMKRLTYFDMCLQESQRLYPSAFRTERECVKDVTINGYFIPKGTVITVPIIGLHHDPEYWSDPEVYDPERFNEENQKSVDTYAFHGFGQGPRNCVGMRLGQIEVKMAVVKIIQNFKVTVGSKMQMPFQYEKGFFPKAEGGVWLRLEKR